MKLSKLLSLSILAILPLVGCNKSGGGSSTGGNGGSGGNNKPQAFNITIDWNTAYSSSETVIMSEYSYSGIDFVFDKGSGTNDPAHYQGTQPSARLYAGNTMGITINGEFTSIEITCLDKAGEVSVNTGTVSSTNTSSSWSGNAGNVIFTLTSGQRRMTSITLSGVGVVSGGQGGGSQGGGGQGQGSAINTQIGLIEYMAKAFTGKSSVALNTDYYQDTNDGSYYIYDEVTVAISEATYKSTVETYVDLIPEDYLAYADESNNYVVVDATKGYAYADFASEDADQPNVIAEIWVQANEESTGFEVYICSYTYAQWQATFSS